VTATHGHCGLTGPEGSGAFAGLRGAWQESSMSRSFDQTVHLAESAPAAQVQVR
jgi:hypothetical protein